MMSRHATTSQTVGPFFTIGLDRLNCDKICPTGVRSIQIRGQVLDGKGNGVPDAVLEIWQADDSGKLDSRAATGFGRIPTQPDGSFAFATVRPGRVAAPDGTLQAPHLNVSIFCRGLLQRLVSRLYFPDEPSNSTDFALKLVPRDRRHTLIARLRPDSGLEWNVVLQGREETVFFDI